MAISTTTQRVYDFLKRVGTFYLATVKTIDGVPFPRVRIFSNVALFEGRLYIQTSKKKEVSEELLSNDNIQIICYDGDLWLRVTARAVTDERVGPKQRMIDENPLLDGWFKADDDVTHVLYLTEATAKIESLSPPLYGNPEVLKF